MFLPRRRGADRARAAPRLVDEQVAGPRGRPRRAGAPLAGELGAGQAADLRGWTGLGARPVAAASGGGWCRDDRSGRGRHPPRAARRRPPSRPWRRRPRRFPRSAHPRRAGPSAWYLGAHAPALFDRSGNTGSQRLGAWARRERWAPRGDGEVVVRLWEYAGCEATVALAAAAERLGERVRPVRVTPRCRAPLEREAGGGLSRTYTRRRPRRERLARRASVLPLTGRATCCCCGSAASGDGAPDGDADAGGACGRRCWCCCCRSRRTVRRGQPP